MIPIAKIQAHLRASASAQFELISTPGFSCFINPDDDSTGSNYAIPTSPDAGHDADALDAMMDVFVSRKRRPCLEYITAFAPALSDRLEARGFVAEAPTLLMICTRETYVPTPGVGELTIRPLTNESAIQDMVDVMTVQRRAFGNPDADAPSEDEALQFRRRYGANTFFIGTLDDRAVTAGSLQIPYQGIAEIAGIATLPEFQRRGLATALTAAIVDHSFDLGLEALFLTAADEKAGRVYAKVGFQAEGEAVAYTLPT